jgi:sec-independent protein translocase protein TatA
MLNTILLFFNIGPAELFVVVLVVIIFFGSKKIPELMRGLGKGIREFKNATSDIQEEINKNVRSIEKEVDPNKGSDK